jgi:flagellar motor switch protein FliG
VDTELDRQKYKHAAAILTQLFLDDWAPETLNSFSERAQFELINSMKSLSLIEKNELEFVIGKFVDTLDSTSFAARPYSDTLEKYSNHLSPSLRKQLKLDDTDVPFEMLIAKLRTLPVPVIMNILKGESDEVAALILDNLSNDVAAKLLNVMDGADARRKTYMMSLLDQERCGESLLSPLIIKVLGIVELNHDTSSDLHLVSGRIGALLSTISPQQREQILTGLTEADPKLGEDVRNKIFTFNLIPSRIAKSDVPLLARSVEKSSLLQALKHEESSGTEQGSVIEFLIENLPKRMGEQLREEMADITPPPADEGEAAQNSVIASIQAMLANGEIKLHLVSTS